MAVCWKCGKQYAYPDRKEVILPNVKLYVAVCPYCGAGLNKG